MQVFKMPSKDKLTLIRVRAFAANLFLEPEYLWN